MQDLHIYAVLTEDQLCKLPLTTTPLTNVSVAARGPACKAQMLSKTPLVALQLILLDKQSCGCYCWAGTFLMHACSTSTQAPTRLQMHNHAQQIPTCCYMMILIIMLTPMLIPTRTIQTPSMDNALLKKQKCNLSRQLQSLTAKLVAVMTLDRQLPLKLRCPLRVQMDIVTVYRSKV